MTPQSSKSTILQSGTLPKTGGSYQLALLTADHIDDILSLQDTVYANLTAAEKAFIVCKDRAFFEQHFATGNVVLGVFHQGKLIAQSLMVHPTPQHPKTGMVDMQLPAPTEKIAVLQGMIVHPDFRGNALMALMTKAQCFQLVCFNAGGAIHPQYRKRSGRRRSGVQHERQSIPSGKTGIMRSVQ
jgi:hypothetical protein